MTQPDYVPLNSADRVRPVERLPVPECWTGDRPADQAHPEAPDGQRFGRTGPDLGYGLKLARRFEGRLEVKEGESREDAITGCALVGTRRAAAFGRAPVIYDMELAFTVWGFLGGAPTDLVEFRRPLFAGAAHHYWEQRGLVDRVREETLRLRPAQIRDRLSSWRELLDV